jgi:TatD DNase family protein
MLVDSHCHLDYLAAEEDLDAVTERARRAGVGTLVTICTKLSEFDLVHAIARKQPDVWCSVGVHPHEAADEGQKDPARLLELAALPEVVGIGETGLDYYYDNSPRRQQRESFRVHIEAARRSGLPLIVHTRDADEDTVSILREGWEEGAYSGVIHCFTAGPALAQAALELGFYISISGILTFKKAESLRETIRELPLERLLVETDAPYLAPAPHRGKRNEPAYVTHTAAALAKLKEVSEAELAATTTRNFFTLFSKARPPAAAAQPAQ